MKKMTDKERIMRWQKAIERLIDIAVELAQLETSLKRDYLWLKEVNINVKR